MSHVYKFIYCYGFYFNLISYIEFQFLIGYNFNVLRLQIEIYYYVCIIIHLLEFESALSSFLILSRQVLFSIQGKDHFPPLPPLTIVFYIKLINFLITHECEHSFWLLLPSEIQYQAFVFSSFGRWQGGSGPRGGQKWMRMKNRPPFIINRSFPGGGLQGGAFHKCSDIYTPHPKTAPYQGMLNRYFPSRERP